MMLESKAFKNVQSDVAGVKTQVGSIGSEVSDIKKMQSDGFGKMEKMLECIMMPAGNSAGAAAAAAFAKKNPKNN
eukprot:9227106-Karenia_brevis.AAC.1